MSTVTRDMSPVRFHLGQLGYLRRASMGDALSTDAVSANRVAEAVRFPGVTSHVR